MILWCYISVIYHLYDGDISHDSVPRPNNDDTLNIILKSGIITRSVINQCFEQVQLVKSLAIDQVAFLHNDTVYQNNPVIEQLEYAD